MGMKKSIEATTVLETGNTLGEGPLWHSIHQMLYWVDIEEKVIHGHEPHTGRHRHWPMSKKVSTIAPASNGNFVLGLQGEIAEFDAATGKASTLVQLESDLPENRCNDGKCDPAGRFWVGTMHTDTKPGAGSLYCVDRDLRVHKVLSGLTIANGMGWSRDGKHMYFIDSAEYCVKQFTFHTPGVGLTDEKIILDFKNKDEQPDGMCVDAEGMLWIGFWGGSRVGRYDPATGHHLADVRVPAPHVTSCTFGGKELDTMYITTARQGLTAEELKEYPLSGSLFSCMPDTNGTDAAIFEIGPPA